MMVRHLPGGLDKFEELLRDQSRSPASPKTQPRSPQPPAEPARPEDQTATQKALYFDRMTRKSANNKKNHDSDKAAFGEFGQDNRDILAWKTENRNYGSEEVAAIEKPVVRNYNSPALTTNSRSNPPSRSLRQPRGGSQLLSPAPARKLSIPQPADEPRPDRVAALQQYELELPVRRRPLTKPPARLLSRERGEASCSLRTEQTILSKI